MPSHKGNMEDVFHGQLAGYATFQQNVERDIDRVIIFEEDFINAAGGTLPEPWSVNDVSAAGAPTKDYVALAGGWYGLTLANDDELETLTLYPTDVNVIPGTGLISRRLTWQELVFDAKVNITVDTALGADDFLLVGIGSALNADEDLIANNAWFRLKTDGAAGFQIFVESDDGTTDNDDVDTGVVGASGDTVIFRIVMKPDDEGELTAYFYVRTGHTDATQFRLLKTLAVPAWSQNAQPLVQVSKAGGLNINHSAKVDYLRVQTGRG